MRWAALLLNDDVSVFNIRVIVVQKSETHISPNLASLKKRTSSFEDAFINLLYYSFPKRHFSTPFRKFFREKHKSPSDWHRGGFSDCGNDCSILIRNFQTFKSGMFANLGIKRRPYKTKRDLLSTILSANKYKTWNRAAETAKKRSA